MIGLSDDGARPRMPHPLPGLDDSLRDISRLHAEQIWERVEMARKYAEEMEDVRGQSASTSGEVEGTDVFDWAVEFLLNGARYPQKK